MTQSTHDVIESALVDIVPVDGLEDDRGVTHTACSLAFRIENDLREAGHLNTEKE